MDIGSVNEVMQVLHRIESLASTWVLPASSDAEPSRNTYEEIRGVCRSIAGTLDDILLDRVEDSDGDSEPDDVCIFFFEILLVLTFIYQPVREGSSKKSARIAYD